MISKCHISYANTNLFLIYVHSLAAPPVTEFNEELLDLFINYVVSVHICVE